MDELNAEWADLTRAATAKGVRLKQAEGQKDLNEALDDAHLKLDEMQEALSSKDLGLHCFLSRLLITVKVIVYERVHGSG